MTDASKSRLIAELERVWERYPDMRFGQLVDFLAECGRPDDSQATSNIDDEQFVTACEELLRSSIAVDPTILQTTTH